MARWFARIRIVSQIEKEKEEKLSAFLEVWQRNKGEERGEENYQKKRSKERKKEIS